MPDSLSLVGFAIALVSSGLFVYAGYWALVMRRTLLSKILRRQALSVAAIGVYFAFIWLATPFTDPLVTVGNQGFAYAAALFFIGFILIFLWIDSSMRVARRADPLHRNTWSWSRARRVIWVFIALDTLTLVGVSVRLAITGQPITLEENIGFFILILLILLVGAPALAIGGRRSGDPTLQRSLRWFAGFVGGILSFTFIGYLDFVLGLPSSGANLGYDLVTFLIGLLPVFAAYSLYRSARALVPTSSLISPE